MKLKVRYILILTLTLFASASYADTNKEDFEVINKVLSFCKYFNEVNYKIAIIANAPTKDAKKIQQIAKDFKTDARIYSIYEIDKIKEHVVILEDSINIESQLKIKEKFYNKPVITISTNLDCVKQGNCMLGIQAKPVTKILLNEEILQKTGLVFSRQFNFMIKKV